MDGHCNVGWGPGVGNGRDSGASAGSEARYKFPQVDVARWDEATPTITGAGKWQGEAGQLIGAYVNTMKGTRGQIMGGKGPGNPGTGEVPDRGFAPAGGGPRPNPGMHR